MSAPATDLRQGLIEVYLRHWTSFRQLLNRRTRSVEIAEDALQETWFRLNALEGDTPYLIRDRQAFILRVAGNIAIDLARRERRHTARAISDADMLAAIADAAPSPETVVIDRQNLRALAHALAALPAKPRTALLLSRCHGLTHAEIAARLRVSPSMVAKYLAQALRHCRDAMRALDATD